MKKTSPRSDLILQNICAYNHTDKTKLNRKKLSKNKEKCKPNITKIL